MGWFDDPTTAVQSEFYESCVLELGDRSDELSFRQHILSSFNLASFQRLREFGMISPDQRITPGSSECANIDYLPESNWINGWWVHSIDSIQSPKYQQNSQITPIALTTPDQLGQIMEHQRSDRKVVLVRIIAMIQDQMSTSEYFNSHFSVTTKETSDKGQPELHCKEQGQRILTGKYCDDLSWLGLSDDMQLCEKDPYNICDRQVFRCVSVPFESCWVSSSEKDTAFVLKTYDFPQSLMKLNEIWEFLGILFPGPSLSQKANPMTSSGRTAADHIQAEKRQQGDLFSGDLWEDWNGIQDFHPFEPRMHMISCRKIDLLNGNPSIPAQCLDLFPFSQMDMKLLSAPSHMRASLVDAQNALMKIWSERIFDAINDLDPARRPRSEELTRSINHLRAVWSERGLWRERTIELIASCFNRQESAITSTRLADLILLHMISRVTSRLDGMAIGSLVLNFKNAEPGAALALSHLYSLLLPRVVFIDKETERPFTPTYSDGKVCSAALQVPNGTVVIIEESLFQKDLSNPLCRRNLRDLNDLTSSQTLKYTFTDFEAEFLCDFPTVLFSLKESLADSVRLYCHFILDDLL